MAGLRTGVILLALCAGGTAVAQPGQPAPPAPPAPAPAPAPADSAPQDPYGSDVLNEQIAEQLVSRASELLDAKFYLDAKQLAVEALVKSPKGTAADRARFIIKTVNQHLDIKEDPPPTPPSEVKPNEDVDTSPIDGKRPFDPSRDAPPDTEQPLQTDNTIPDPRTAGMIHGGLYGGIIGSTIGALASKNKPAAIIPLGIASAAGFALLSRPVVKKLGWNEAQVRTAGSINFWGGAIGGLFAEAVTGEGDKKPSARGVLLGASIGSTVGLVAGGVMAKNKKLTRGDVALVDTLAGIGAVGGLTMGMLMQPAQPEAYSVNSILGIAGGVVIGVVAAPQTNTTPRRMLRVAGLSAAGGAIPFLLYAAIYDSNSDGDERVVGLLSSAGLIGGAYLGFRLTRGMDDGLDTHDGKKKVESPDDAPVALVGRSSDGAWSFGGVSLQPLPRKLATNNPGATLTIAGATF